MAGGYSSGSGFESIMRSGTPSRALASAAPATAKAYLGMDLKKYLPGVDPGRISLNGRSAEINGKGVDLFKKISDKLKEKCKLQILFDCNS
jgi:hypothetical protein